MLTRLLEARDSVSGAPGKAQQFPDPLDQRRLKKGTKIRGNDHRAASGPRESPNKLAVNNPFLPPFLWSVLRTVPFRRLTRAT